MPWGRIRLYADYVDWPLWGPGGGPLDEDDLPPSESTKLRIKAWFNAYDQPRPDRPLWKGPEGLSPDDEEQAWVDEGEAIRQILEAELGHELVDPEVMARLSPAPHARCRHPGNCSPSEPPECWVPARAGGVARCVCDPGVMPERRAAAGRTAAAIAAALGLGHALVSAYWATGGTALLDTIGGDIERWGREREPALVVALWLIVLVKLVVALAAPVLAGWGAGRLPAWTRAKVPRVLGGIAAGALLVYGGLFTAAGLAVKLGLLDRPADADGRALAWHAYFWDPWFLLWGLAFAASLWLTGTSEARRSSSRPVEELRR